jgi:hypothetical protein
MFGETDHATRTLGRIRGEFGVVSTPVNGLIEREAQNDADVWSVSQEELQWRAVIEGRCGDAVTNEASVLKRKEPTVIRCARAVEKAVDVLLEGLVTAFSEILMLVISLRLPRAYEVGTEDVFNGLAEFDLGSVGEELSRCAAETKDIEELVLELFFRAHG